VYAEQSAAASLPEDGGSDSEGQGDGDADAAPSHDRSPLPALTAMFVAGQRVRCLVIRLSEGSGEQGRRVDLSLRLSKLHAASGLTPKGLRPGRCLAACVTSVEDHGYMLSFGLPPLAGFLPLRAAPGRASAPLAPGSLLETVVTAMDLRRRLVSVTCEAEALRGCAPLAEEDQPALQALQPGDLVSCRVRAVLADGLSLSFLGLFSGTVDWFHLGRGTHAGAKPLAVAFPQHGRLGAAFAVQDRCKARILTVDPATKKLSLTLRPEHVAGLPAPELPRMGTRLPGCTIRRIDPSVGLLLQLPLDGDDDTPPAYAGYAHVRRFFSPPLCQCVCPFGC
jgi:rRNA biogenesis protein RRP5